jgi:hypothetical protein
MIKASALLHQYQRQKDASGRLIANQDDYCIVKRLLQEPMKRLLGGGIGEPARRFFTRLREWFGTDSFTTRDAKAKEDTSRASVYGWLKELHDVGAIEQVEAHHGAKPAIWRLADQDFDKAEGKVLPHEDEVFREGPC